MEKALLPESEEREGERVVRWGLFVEEVKRVSCMAAPMVVVGVSQYLLQVVSIMMVGHLGELELSSVSIATSLCGVTGFSLLFGMACALETLCGQAYGAKQYHRLGIYTYSAMICLILVCIPVSFLWFFMEKLLTFIGQDPSVSIEAGRYSIWLIPTLYAYAVLQSLLRYLLSQSLILPMLFTSFATLCFHIPLCWALVFKLELKILGAALAIGLSNWLNVIVLVIYVKNSSTCAKTLVPFSKDVFRRAGEFLRFAVPSAVMACLEWWSIELLILLSGLLPNSKLETSVLSICITNITLHYFIPYGFAAAASTRVSNELGAGNPLAARIAVLAAVVLTIMEAVIVCAALLCSRYILGYAYSDEKEVLDYFEGMVPLLCLSVIMDSLQAVLSGVARGCGWQHIGAYVNLGAYYLIGIPLAAILGFYLYLRGKGLWIGILSGATVQAILLSLITSMTNWQKQATKARERILEGNSSVENILTSGVA